MASKSTRKNTTPAVDDELVELLGEQGAQVWAANPGELTTEADEHLTQVIAENEAREEVIAVLEGQLADELTDPQEEAEAILEEAELAELPVADGEVVDEEQPAPAATQYTIAAINCYGQEISLAGQQATPEALTVDGSEGLNEVLTGTKTGWFAAGEGFERHRIVQFKVARVGDDSGHFELYQRANGTVDRMHVDELLVPKAAKEPVAA